MRTATWIAAASIGYAASGVLSLFGVAYAASAVAGDLTAREYVLATQSLLWLVVSGAVALWIGRALFASVAPRLSALAALSGTTAVVVAFAIYADARARTEAIDIDQLGLAIWASPGLIAMATAQLAADAAPPNVRRAWQWALFVAALVTILVTSLALMSPVRYGVPSVAALAAAVAVGLVTAPASFVAARSSSTGH